jgi:glycerate kinase
MNILVVSDSFKGTLGSAEIGRIVQEELRPVHRVDYLPVSDGGEGFIESMESLFPGKTRTVSCRDPLGREIYASYLITDDRTAIIESARACGLGLLTETERNPLLASTYGLGMLIRDALGQNVLKVVAGLGGSATNDGGTGMLRALGVRMKNDKGAEFDATGAADLGRIASIDTSALDPWLGKVSFEAVCDVENPLLGPDGATRVYGPQKGADAQTLGIIEAGMSAWARTVVAATGRDETGFPGAGAAGGLGFCLRSLFGADLVKGTEALIRLTRLEEKADQYDLIITGEGRFDAQSESGKIPMGMLQLGQRHGIPVICLCAIDASKRNPGFAAIHAVVPQYATEEQSVKEPEKSLRKAVRGMGGV